MEIVQHWEALVGRATPWHLPPGLHIAKLAVDSALVRGSDADYLANGLAHGTRLSAPRASASISAIPLLA